MASERGKLLILDPDGNLEEHFDGGSAAWNNFSFGRDGEVFLNTERSILSLQPDLARVAAWEPPPPPSETPGLKIVTQDDYVVVGGLRLPRKRQLRSQSLRAIP